MPGGSGAHYQYATWQLLQFEGATQVTGDRELARRFAWGVTHSVLALGAFLIGRLSGESWGWLIVAIGGLALFISLLFLIALTLESE